MDRPVLSFLPLGRRQPFSLALSCFHSHAPRVCSILATFFTLHNCPSPCPLHPPPASSFLCPSGRARTGASAPWLSSWTGGRTWPPRTTSSGPGCTGPAMRPQPTQLGEPLSTHKRANSTCLSKTPGGEQVSLFSFKPTGGCRQSRGAKTKRRASVSAAPLASVGWDYENNTRIVIWSGEISCASLARAPACWERKERERARKREV